MSLISRSFIVNNEQIGQSTLWQLYSNEPALATVIIRLHTQDVNTDWLKDDIKKTYDSSLDKLSADGTTFSLTWSYDITTFTKGKPVYVSYCFIVNGEVCAVGAGDTFDCYSITDENNSIIEVGKTNDEEQEVSALYRQWYKIANLSNVVNDLRNQHKAIEIGEDRVIKMSDNNNVIIQFDNDSELITFRAKRKYDGIDLLTKTLYFYGITPGSKKPIKDLVSVETADDSNEDIIISWKVSNAFADGSGQMDFAIVAEGENITDDYLWQTHPAKMTIHPSILDNIVEFQTLSWNEWQEQLINTIDRLTNAYENGELKWQSISSLLG
jgi:hypothetical protein